MKTQLILALAFTFTACKPDAPKPIEIVPIEAVEAPRNVRQEIEALANANGFNPSSRIIDAILVASEQYGIDALELTAIGIIETGLGKYSATRKNSNGTHDKGVFQINTVNHAKCVEYNLDSPEGSALCAAKLLASIRALRPDYLGVYHSKTPSVKARYLSKVMHVLSVASSN